MSRKFKEYSLETLFKKVNTKRLPYKVSNLKNLHDENYNLPALTAGTSNQGLTCFVPRENATILKNVISISANGDANAFYQPDEFTVLQDAYAIEYKYGILSKECYLYLTTLIQNILKQHNFGWQNKSGWEKVKKCVISLPIKNKYIPNLDELSTIIRGGYNMQSIDTSSWKEFKLCELFEILTTKSIDKNKVIFSKEGKYDFIGRTSMNYGVQGKVDYLGYDANKRNTFSLVQVGESCCLFRENDWYASQNIFVLEPKYEELKENHLFICTLINECLSIYKEAYTYPTLKVLKDLTVKLPATEVEEIDWDFMEQYMKDIESRIRIMLTGLKNVNSENKIIDIKEWKPFKVGNLFEIYPTKSYKDTNSTLFKEGGKVPVIVNSSYNNGIGGYTNKEPTEDGGIITFSDTTTADSIFYQDVPFVGYSHVQGLHPIGEYKDKWNKDRLQFFVSIFKSSAKSKNYDYSNKFTRESASNLIVYLPVKKDNFIDFEYIDKYIQNVRRGGDTCSSGIDTITKMIKWKTFRVGDIFKCETTCGITSKNKLIEGNIPYITRSADNNGMSGTCGNIVKMVKGNCITIGAEGFKAFYQKNDFVAGNKVYALRHPNMAELIGLYLASVLNILSSKYSFADARILDKIKEERILLPLDKDGQPNWTYIEQYMKYIKLRQKIKLELLNIS